MNSAAKFYGIASSGISSVLAKKRPSAAGFKWSYVDKEIKNGEKWMSVNMSNLKFVYQISNLGRIKNVQTGRISVGTMSCGYRRTQLTYNDGKVNNYLIHRLVMSTFEPNTDTSLIVNHEDGNKTNNKLENLKWVTYSENTLHAFKIGLLCRGR